MKVLYLNCWHGKVGDKFLSFIKQKSSEVDVFCLQEVPPDLQKNLKKILKGYRSVYKYILVNNRFVRFYGQSIFIRKSFLIKNSKVVETFKNRKPNYGFLQIVHLFCKDKDIFVANLHGPSQPGHKLDTKSRLNQSRIIVDSMKEKKGLKIIGGDFNLEPVTKSIKIIENSGYINLISKFKIKTTRNSIAWKESKYHDKVGLAKYYKKQFFADYCFVNNEIAVKNFEVPNISISDHLPLILDIDL